MSRATNDLNAVRMMIGPSIMYSAQHAADLRRRAVLMMSIDARLTLLALIPLPFVSISVKVLRQRHPQAVRADSGAAVRDQRGRAGSAVGRPRRARLSAGGARSWSGSGGERGVPAPEPRLIVLQGFFFPSMALFLGLGALLVLWLGSREVITRPDHASASSSRSTRI